MDATRFDRLTRLFTEGSSRRGLLRGVAAALGLAAAQFPGGTDAKRRHKPKKPKSNKYGCLDVGQACAGSDGTCCSGICQGKKPKKGKSDKSRCAAHNVGGCQAGQDFCGVESVPCGTNGFCSRTTGNAGFCGAVGGAIDCFACQRDVDCEAGFGPGAACIVCSDCTVTGNTTCLPAGT